MSALPMDMGNRPMTLDIGSSLPEQLGHEPEPFDYEIDGRVSTKSRDRFGLADDIRNETAMGFLFSFDRDRRTEIKCVAALVLGILLCVTCFSLALSILVQHPNMASDHPNNLLYKMKLPGLSVEWSIEVISLVVNFGITLCLEGLSYIHAVSLRWALFREGRLDFNTNFRLFTASRKSAPHRWYTNMISAVCLILSYASTSLLFIKSTPAQYIEWYPGISPETSQSHIAFVNSAALVCLSVGLIGHVLIAVSCLWPSSSYIPTWSSNPVNNTFGMLRDRVQHRRGRCMMAAIEKSVGATQVKSRAQQISLIGFSSSARWVVVLVWTITLFSAAWTVSMGIVCSNYVKGGGGFWTDWKDTLSWSANTYKNLNTYRINMNPAYNLVGGVFLTLGWQLVCSVLFLFVVQGLQTLSLHCAELVVNTTRDEKVWRKMDSRPPRPRYLPRLTKCQNHDTNLKTNAFVSALDSWEYCMLFAMKSVLHWIMGQAFSLTYDYAGSRSVIFAIVYSRLIIYTIIAIILAVFITCIGLRKPQGPQPAAWGHIQTLADLIDDWQVDEKGSMWWGDKGATSEGIRHAGTSANRASLGEIQRDAMYAGIE